MHQGKKNKLHKKSLNVEYRLYFSNHPFISDLDQPHFFIESKKTTKVHPPPNNGISLSSEPVSICV